MTEILIALKAWTHWVLGWVFILIVLSYVISLLPIGLDDSDKSARKRSDMKIYTDYKTGLQYLGSSKGGLTPRLNVDGTQMRSNEWIKDDYKR